MRRTKAIPLAVDPAVVAQRAQDLNSAFAKLGLLIGRAQERMDRLPKGTFVIARIESGSIILAGLKERFLADWFGQCVVVGTPTADRLARWCLAEIEMAEAEQT